MSNPYEPLSSTSIDTPASTNTSFFVGGFLQIALMGIFLGAIAGGLMFGVAWESNLVLAIPAIGWWCATGLLAYSIRNAKFTFSARLLLALLLPIPAYILYIPVCSAFSMATTPFLGGKDYGPTTFGATIGSAIAFFLILMAAAAIVRAMFRTPESDANTDRDATV